MYSIYCFPVSELCVGISKDRVISINAFRGGDGKGNVCSAYVAKYDSTTSRNKFNFCKFSGANPARSSPHISPDSYTLLIHM